MATNDSKTFKVVLTFEYDSKESTKDWNGDIPHEFVENADQAIETAIAEIQNNIAAHFSFNVYDGDGEFIKSN